VSKSTDSQDSIYLVDPQTRVPQAVEPARFEDMGIKERQDFQEWVAAHPSLLGEELLVLATEFSRFERGNRRRADIIALDKNGALVVIELKLRLDGELADLQVLRYAAFCSSMTSEQVVEQLAEFTGTDPSEAEEKILQFVESEELPALEGKPRMIVAAGSVNDQELTTTVLWLRNFGLDISCVELTPYRLQGYRDIVLVPRVIIPLPEARDYMIGIEKREISKLAEARTRMEYLHFWERVVTAFSSLNSKLNVSSLRNSPYIQIPTGIGGVHYEWVIRKRKRSLDVCLHFERRHREANLELLGALETLRQRIESLSHREYSTGPFMAHAMEARFAIPFDKDMPDEDAAIEAANLMAGFIEVTLETVRQAGLKEDAD